MNKRGEQVILSPEDERDYTVGAYCEPSGSYPTAFSVWQPPVENQGTVGNCVAQALANVMECIKHREGCAHRDYSVGFIYGTQQTCGMIPREACGALVREGDVLRSLWECLDENPACHNLRQAVPEEIKDKADKALAYIRINTLSELKAFMLKYGLPALLIAPTSAYVGYGSGYHATACFGWSYDCLLYTNSWGMGGALGDGTGEMNFSETTEIWGVIPMERKRFKDIGGHWAQRYIEEMSECGILHGYEDGLFRPDKAVTRAELAKVASMLLAEIDKGFTKG